MKLDQAIRAGQLAQAIRALRAVIKSAEPGGRAVGIQIQTVSIPENGDILEDAFVEIEVGRVILDYAERAIRTDLSSLGVDT